jgi:cytochrome c oxidase subunit 3
MYVALVPILVLFLALVAAYAVRRDVGWSWTPRPLPRFLWFTTAILAASSLVLERARAVHRRGDEARCWITGTLVLGIAFVVGQALAWWDLVHQGVGIAATPHASFFYVLTGAHAVHVAGGLAGLAAAVAWPVGGWRGTDRGVALRVVAIYWHFLFVLWCLLYAVLSIWR